MIILGIESTAHTFAASVITRKGEILSDVRSVFRTEKGGMIPNEVARHHSNVADEVIREAISKSRQRKLDLVAYSSSPGLSPCLRVGLEKAKEFAKELNAEILGVNHCVSHLTSGHLFTKAKNPIYIYTSGANTQIISLEGNKFRIFGECLDIGMGNALDKFGREIGLGFPAGPLIEKLAKKGKYVKLPYVVKGMDLSFSGIITSAINKFSKGVKKEDLCYSIQENFFSMLTEVSERALAHTNKNEILLIGGVAANKRLCEMLEKMCKDRNAKFYAIPLKYAADNSVMIAYQGFLEYSAGKRENIEESDINPNERTDQINVIW